MVRSTPTPAYRLEVNSRNVVTVRMDVKAGWEQWFLLRSDAHHDNPHTNQDLEREHLEQALERKAGIIDAGDLFCAMQGKWDKRACKNDLRPEHQSGDYLDALVRTAAEFYEPYAQNIVVLGQGNHETGILKAHETNLTERLGQSLRDKTRAPVPVGGYSGWVRFLFNERSDVGRGHSQSRTLHYFHGGGGGGPVTRGVIQTNRMAAYLADADIVLTGHTHDQFALPIRRIRLSVEGKVISSEQLHIKAPGYKDAWGDGYGGFEVERMHNPKPTGAYWIRFYLRNKQIYVEETRAQ